jgi:hypothetical protein
MNVTIENFVGIFEDAFSKEYCDKVIEFFEDSVKAGLGVTRQQQGEAKTLKDDTQVYAHSELQLKYGSATINEFNDIFWRDIYPTYAAKYEALKDSGTHQNYAFKIQKTKIGGGYHIWHYESGTREASTRLLTWTLYLNDVEEGGETEFLYYPKRVKPKAGTLLLWPAGFTHTHRGNPPISNTKYIVTGWLEF